MKRFTISGICVLLIALSIQAQTVNTYQDTLQEVLDFRQGSGTIPGISAAVMIHEVGIWKGVAGESHAGVKMRDNMLLGIASNTKLFTAVLCLKLVEQGLLSMEDPLSKWLPNFANVDPNITLRQLLQHQSGVHDYTDTPNFFDSVVNGANVFWDPYRIMSLVQAPYFTAGANTQYSNTNYILAGMILEAATKTSYRNLVRDSILTPLNLTNTYLEGLESVPSRLAHPWWQGKDYYNTSRKAVGSLSWASGCMVSTPEDMVKWYDAVFNQGFLSDQGIEELKQFVFATRVPYPMGISLLEVPHFGRKYWGFAGKTLGFNSFFLYDPEYKHAVAVMVNDTKNKAETVAKDLIKRIYEVTSVATSVEHRQVRNFGLQVYPNPTRDKVFIQFAINPSEVIGLDVFDLQGRKVMRIVDHQDWNRPISFHQLNSGMYKIVLRTLKGIQSTSILVQ